MAATSLSPQIDSKPSWLAVALLSLASLSLAGLVNAPALSQESSQKIYGKLNLSLEMKQVNTEARAEGDTDGDAGEAEGGADGDATTVEVNTIWDLQSNASWLGVKGDYKSSADALMTLIYQLEYEVAPDDGSMGSSGALKQRNSYVGIQTEYGELILGFHDTPLKKAQLQVDQFNDTTYDIRELLRGQTRDSMVHYTSPKLFKGLRIKLALVDSATGLDGVGVGLEESASVSVAYEHQFSGHKVQVAFAADTGISGYNRDILAVQLDLASGIRLGLLTQNSEESDEENAKSFAGLVISGGYKWGNHSAYVQTYSSDEIIAGGSFVGLGYDYQFDPNAKWTLWYGSMSADSADELRLDDDPPVSSIATGLEVRF